ncbi:hypothetical protein GBA52_005578 [Prunus armeniaca]|nr:hypothetical protein GBA52_005578 [Prunus armeniaca]
MATMTKAELPLLVLFLSTLLLATSVPSARAQVTCEEGCYSISDQSKVGECLQMCSSHGQSCEDRCMREARWPQQQEQCLIMCRQQEQGHHLPCREQCIRSPDREMCERACQQQQGQGGGRQCLQQCKMITRDPRERLQCVRTCMQGQQQQQQVEQQCRQHCQSERHPMRQQECQEYCVGQMMQQEYEQQCRSRCQWERPRREQQEQCQEECTEKIRQLEQCQEGCKMQGQYGPQQQECQRMCREQFEQGQGIRMVA